MQLVLFRFFTDFFFLRKLPFTRGDMLLLWLVFVPSCLAGQTTTTFVPTTTTSFVPTTTQGEDRQVLSFDSNLACQGTCSSSSPITTYGSTSFCLVRYGTFILGPGSAIGPENELFWYNGGSYSFPSGSGCVFGDQDKVSQITIRGQTRLESFKLGAFSAGDTVAVRVVDLADNATLFSSPTLKIGSGQTITISGPWQSTTGLAVLVDDLYYVALKGLSVFLVSTAFS